MKSIPSGIHVSWTELARKYQVRNAQGNVSAIDFGTKNISIRSLLYWLNDLDDERKLVTSFSLLPKIFVIELLFSRPYKICFRRHNRVI
jgi:hypothetical protein